MNPNSESANVREFLVPSCRGPGPFAVQRGHLQNQGKSSGGYSNFETVLTELGLKYCWILTPVNSLSEIRRSFPIMSQSASDAARERRRSAKLQWEALRREA